MPYRKAKRWVEVWRKAGAVMPRKFGKIAKLDDHEAFLRALVAQRPEIKLGETRAALAQHDVKTSHTAIWNALERFDITLAGRRRPVGDQRPKSSPARDDTSPPIILVTPAHQRAAN